MDFEWDPEKAKANELKHDLSFPEGASVFGDPLAITFPDPDHSVVEGRYLNETGSIRSYLAYTTG